MCIVVTTGLLTCLVFIVTVYYLLQSYMIKEIVYDAETCMVTDYAVELPILSMSYERWFRKIYQPGDFHRGVSPNMSFKVWMMSEIESALKEHKVADIVFPYENKELIERLAKRGDAIVNHDWKRQHEIEREIQATSFSQIDKLRTPTQSIFVTFCTQEGKQAALSLSPKAEHLFLNRRFVETTQPSDIIWENRWNSWRSIRARELVSFVLIAGIMWALFTVVFQMTAYTQQFLFQYPTADCDGVKKAYTDNFEVCAVQDYLYIGENAEVRSAGCLSCFCEQEKAAYGLDALETKGYGS